TLYSDGQNISAQTLQDTQANLANLRAKLISAQASSDALLSQIQQQFGPALKHFAESTPGKFKRLQSGQSCIVRIALPPDSTFTPTHKDHLELPSMPDLNAAYLSAAPIIDPSTEGPAFLYLLDATLPAGTRMPARLVKTGAHILKGVRIPAQALVWFGGQPWVYIKLDNSHFERRPLGSDRSLKDGYFASQSFKAGDIVVTRGSQLLLSDELRPPPNSVAACKDPECND
ncbi:MAG TPA: metal transporter, partial [Limnobacter sp.]|nr:metal transporter [Limnobacter sp.]